jgi:hypothetical protein
MKGCKSLKIFFCRDLASPEKPSTMKALKLFGKAIGLVLYVENFE